MEQQYFSLSENQKKLLLIFHKIVTIIQTMEKHKIVNLLNDIDNKNLKFATKKQYIIDNELEGNYSHKNEIKFLTNSLESSLCDYSDGYILVTGNTNVVGGDANTKVAFKNCAPFTKCISE